VLVDMTNASVLEFANNEAYGTMQTGLACVWNGTISKFTVWHPSHHGFSGIPLEKLIVDKLTVRGDVSVLGHPSEKPIGVWISSYISKRNVTWCTSGWHTPFPPRSVRTLNGSMSSRARSSFCASFNRFHGADNHAVCKERGFRAQHDHVGAHQCRYRLSGTEPVNGE
jgi:hypothetical protein